MSVEQELLIPTTLDRNTFCILINDRKEKLYRLAYMYVKNRDDALEIVQESIYKAYLSFEKLKEVKYFNTWLTRIVINCSLDYIRKRKRLTFFEENISMSKSYEEDKDDVIDLYTSVDKLKGNLKTVIILKYFEDLSINSIAEVLECSVSTVKNNLHKALEILRIQLKEENL